MIGHKIMVAQIISLKTVIGHPCEIYYFLGFNVLPNVLDMFGMISSSNNNTKITKTVIGHPCELYYSMRNNVLCTIVILHINNCSHIVKLLVLFLVKVLQKHRDMFCKDIIRHPTLIISFIYCV